MIKYVNELARCANNELAFQEKLLEACLVIQNDKQGYEKAKSFVENVNSYCKQRMSDTCIHEADKKAYILEVDDFFMFVLNRLFENFLNEFNFYKESLVLRYGQKDLPVEMRELVNQIYVNYVCAIMKNSFKTNTKLSFEKVKDKQLVSFIKRVIMPYINTDVLFDVCGVKPIVFVAEKGSKGDVFPQLSLTLLNLNDYEFVVSIKKGCIVTSDNAAPELCNNIANSLIKCCMEPLMEDILCDSDLEYLAKTYSIDKDNLRYAIGKETALYMSGNNKEYSPLLKDVIELSSKRRNLPEKKLEKIKEKKVTAISKEVWKGVHF